MSIDERQATSGGREAAGAEDLQGGVKPASGVASGQIVDENRPEARSGKNIENEGRLR